MTTSAKPFNPNEHLRQLKSQQGIQDYLDVKWRLVWFREQCPEGSIETEIVHLDLDRETESEAFVWNNEKRRSEKVIKTAPGIVIFRATVKDGKGGVATGTKMEKASAFGDYLEKSETGAIGRALAALGYGTQFANDLDEGDRPADAPVDRAPSAPFAAPTQATPRSESREPRSITDTVASASEQQMNTIKHLCQQLGKPAPDRDLSYDEAAEMIKSLVAEQRSRKK